MVGCPDQPTVLARGRDRHALGAAELLGIRPGPRSAAAGPGRRTAGDRAVPGWPAPDRSGASGHRARPNVAPRGRGCGSGPGAAPPVAPADQPGRPGPAAPAPPPRRRNEVRAGAGRSRGRPPGRPAPPGGGPPRCRPPGASRPSRAVRSLAPDTSTAATPVRADSSSVARETPIRRSFRRVESHSAHSGGRVRPHRRHASSPPASGWAVGPAAARAPSQGAAVGAGQQAGPPRAVEDAHHPALRSGRGRHGGPTPAARRTARCGGRRRSVHDVDRRPPPALHRPRSGDHVRTLQQGHRSGTASPAARAHRLGGPARPPPRPPTRSAPAPRGTPRRVHRAPRRPRRPCQRGPRRRPRADHHPAAGGGLRPGVGQQGDGRAGRSEAVRPPGSARGGEGARTSSPAGPSTCDQTPGRSARRRAQAPVGPRSDRPDGEGLGDHPHRGPPGDATGGRRPVPPVPGVPSVRTGGRQGRTTRAGEARPEERRAAARPSAMPPTGPGPPPAAGAPTARQGDRPRAPPRRRRPRRRPTTQAPTRRPWRSIRTRLPDPTRSASAGERVVERRCAGRGMSGTTRHHAGPVPPEARPRRRCAGGGRCGRRSEPERLLQVVHPGGVLPGELLLRRGRSDRRRRSSGRSDASGRGRGRWPPGAGRRCSSTAVGDRSRVDLLGAERLHQQRHRPGHADGVGHLDLAPAGGAGGDHVLGHPAAPRRRPSGRPWRGPCPRRHRRRGGPCPRRCRR